jgi:hypothetical protein
MRVWFYNNEYPRRDRENDSTQVQSNISLPHIFESILQRNQQKVLEAHTGGRNHPAPRRGCLVLGFLRVRGMVL